MDHQIGEENQVFYEKLYRGGVAGSTVLPNQVIPQSKKNDKWKKACLDSLEHEALKQYYANLKFKDYYDMVSGKLVYSDITGKDQDYMYTQMRELQKEIKELPSYLRHWDLMYPVLSVLTGEQLLEEDKFRFDTTDEVSTNEYIREKTAKLEKYTELVFKKELEKLLLIRGISMQGQPASEEEAKQRQQEIDAQIDKYFPPHVQEDMNKNWKTKAAQWAEKTWERDTERFRIKHLKFIETKDFLLTGRAPRHYYLGKNNYYPERWHPIETFHSKEDDLHNYKDAEFAGRLKFYSVSELLSKYGHRFSQKAQEKIAKAMYGDEFLSSADGSSGKSTMDFTRNFTEKTVPFEGYTNYKQTLALQENFNVSTVWEEDLTTGVQRPGYLPKLFGDTYPNGNNLTAFLRNDFQPRTDTIATLECYWRGFKKVGILTYRTDSGSLRTTEISEDIEKEVIKELGLKNLKSVSEIEYDILSADKKENTIIWKYVPVIYEGLKANISSIFGGGDDLYVVEEMEVQIRGDKGNLEDLHLPVVGIIDEAPLEKIRPEQMMYNFVLNQNTQYLQKEIGGFFAFDVTMFPTEFMGLSGKGKNALINFRNFVKDTGLMPLDASKHNMMERGGSQFNTLMYQNMTFTDQITRNIQLAEKYKWQAYEKLGITQQRIGSPSKYQSVEGVQVGQTASFSQTANIIHLLNEDERSKIEMHVTVAQHAQLNNKDDNYLYVASDEEISFLSSIQDDEWFDIRKFNIRPLYNFKKRKEVEMLKQILLQNNTMGHDAYALSKIALSDDYLELMEAARQAREYIDSMRQQEQQHQSEESEKILQAQREEREHEYKMHQENNYTRVKVAEIKALGDVADNTNQGDGTDIVIEQAKDYTPDEIEAKKQIEFAKINQRMDESARKLEIMTEKNKLEKRKLDIKEREIRANEYIATVNKN